MKILGKVRYLLVVLSILISSSCSEDGEQGPLGEDVNTNVIASDWFQMRFDDVSISTPPSWAQMYINDPSGIDITEFIDNGGAALMYVKVVYPSNTLVYPLPFRSGDATNITYILVDNPNLVRGINLQVMTTDVSNYENNPDITFKYILIPANTVMANKISKENLPTYEDVAVMFGLKP